jgi:serine/threonine protein kinase
VTFYGFSYDETFFMFIQELCYGGNLREAFLKSPEIVEERSFEFMLQIAAGVEYLHDAKIIHRDIKPENVLLSSADHKTSTLKLADFGQGKVLSMGKSTTAESGLTGGVGTVRYEISLLFATYTNIFKPSNTIPPHKYMAQNLISATWHQNWSRVRMAFNSCPNTS